MEWVTVDTARVLNAFSAARRQTYDWWIAMYPAKVARVEEIIANLVMEFRSGIQANPRNALDPDVSKLPQTCVRYCEELCMFRISVEMGAWVDENERLAVSKAEIFLRSIYTGQFFMTGGEGGAGGSPRYKAGVARDARGLSV